jgi:putative membrane protein
MDPAASLAGLPAFAAYFGLALALLAVFVLVYVQVTPQREFALIRANNHAAAIAFGGALLGFCLPLHAAISNSISLIDCAIWGAVALVVQIAVFVVLRLLIRDLPQRIESGQAATATLAAVVSIGVGLLNAASMSY